MSSKDRADFFSSNQTASNQDASRQDKSSQTATRDIFEDRDHRAGDIETGEHPHLDLEAGERSCRDRLDVIQRALADFVAERDWRQFHSPKNLSMSIAIEAAELMEIFQWETVEESWKIKDDPKRFQHLREELADILAYSIGLANILDLDIEQIMLEKIEKNRAKYPAEKFRGRY